MGGGGGNGEVRMEVKAVGAREKVRESKCN